MPRNTRDYTGERFGKLVALSYHDSVKSQGKSGHTYRRWLCQCDCGRTAVIASFRFSAENEKRLLSCGCENHGNRKYTKEEATYRVYYSYHSKSCNNHKWGFLEYNFWKQVVSQPCASCGAPPEKKGSPSGAPVPLNGVDRIDSSIGYTEQNVQTMCSWCNIAKAEVSMEEFIIRCKRVVDHNAEKENVSTVQSE